MSQAKTGYGAKLYYGSPMLPFAEILTLKKSGEKQANEKVTNQDSPVDTAGRVREELLGTIVSGGTVDMTLNAIWTNTTHRDLFDHTGTGLNDGKPHAFEIRGPVDPLAPDTPLVTIAFDAILFDIPDIDLPLDKQMMLTVKLTITGDVAYSFSS